MDESLAASSGSRKWIVPSRHNAPLVTTTSAFEAYNQVLAGAGTTQGLDSQGNFYWRRDAVDGRIVSDVRNGTGYIINDPSEVGGWPSLASGTPYTDSDHDGMADDWENTHGFNPNNSSDGPQDADGDGYTNLEEFLNGTNPKDGSPFPSPTPAPSNPYDLSGDSQVNAADVFQQLEKWQPGRF